MKWLASVFLFLPFSAFAQSVPFSSAQTIPFDSIRSLSTADVNKDNLSDLIVTNYSSNAVSVLVGNGAGSFSHASGSPFAMGPRPVRAVAGDFNKDTRIDIAVLHEAVQFPVSGGFETAPGVSVYFGTVSGFTLAPATPIRLQGNGASELLVRDMNGDGNPDIVAVTSTPNVIFGNGSGGFASPIVGTAAAFPGATSAAVADFNGDGKQDLAYALTGAPDETGVLLGDGQGRFPQSFGVLLSVLDRDLFSSAWSVTSFATADINGDGFQDLLAISSGRNAVFTWLGSASGMQISPPGFTGTLAGSSPTAMVVADFSGDGKLDFAATNPTASTVSVGLGTGTGFARPLGSPYPAGAQVFTLATADFNLDGRPDLAVAHETGVTILLNTGALASSRAPQTITFPVIGDKMLGAPPFTVTATASSGLPVTFSTNSGVCTVSGNTVTLLMTGFCAIAASHPGNSIYEPAQLVRTFHIGGTTGQSQTIAFAALPDRALVAGPFMVSASASSGLAVTFSSLTPAVCTVSGATVTPVTGGACTIRASQAGNASYGPAGTIDRTFNISATQGAQIITGATPLTYSLSAGSVQITATASSGLPVTLTSTTTDICTVTANQLQLLAVGQCSITATQPGNASFLPAEPLIIRVTITPGLAMPAIHSVLNGASYADGRVAPNSYVSVFGENFGSSPRVTVRDNQNNMAVVTPSYASATQINFVWPASLPAGPATVNVASSVGSAVSTLIVAAVAPALFSADSTGSGLAAAQVLTVRPAQEPVYTLLAAGPVAIPANGDVYLILYGTGIRNRSGAVIARVGDYTAEVVYAGAQSEFPGLDQVNLKLPVSLAGKGTVDIQLLVDGILTNTVTARFQ